jgi:hypothetical protein
VLSPFLIAFFKRKNSLRCKELFCEGNQTSNIHLELEMFCKGLPYYSIVELATLRKTIEELLQGKALDKLSKKKAGGKYYGLSSGRIVEDDRIFVVLIGWETVDDHMIIMHRVDYSREHWAAAKVSKGR